MCTSFEKQASFNIFELDAASHNNVDSMRSLVEQVRYQPQHGRYKVYIIDEAHMLTTQAFNAFLKTLEEPPPYAIFILATTEKHKILPTILSRCQIFDFRRITVKDMVAHLETIAQQEGIKTERDALVTIAQKSDGALRDALSLFDRLAGAAENNLTYQSVVQNLNLLDYEMYFQIADACLREDVRDILLTYDKIVMGGFEGDMFLDGLAAHYRDLLVCRDPAMLSLQDHSDELRDRYGKQATLMTPSYIFSALNLINECDLTYPQVRNKRLHVEIGLTRICFLRRLTEGNPFASEKKTDVEKKPIKQKREVPENKDKAAQIEKGHEGKDDPSPGNGNVHLGPKPKQKSVTIPVLPEIVTTEKTPETKDAGKYVQTGEQSLSDTNSSEIVTQDLLEDEVKEAPDLAGSAVMTSTPRLQVSTAPAMKVLVNTPQLGSLFDLKSTIEKAEQAARENSLVLNEENAVAWWQEFRQTISSPSVAVAFKEAVVTLEEKVMKIVVDSPLAKTRINEENDLLIRFRNAFHDHTLELVILVEESEASLDSKKPKKILTIREKYERLVAKNPAMEVLKNKLGLIVDHDE
jgi:DNA polymerase-3 subunit gamma/tau